MDILVGQGFGPAAALPGGVARMRFVPGRAEARP